MAGRDETAAHREALARARARLAAATGKARLDAVLAVEDPRALVRALPADELYLAIREIGLADAAELVQLASPSQFRTFLDLAAWRGERPQPSRALAWLRAARAGALDSPASERAWRAKLAALDVELLDLLLRHGLVVHDLEHDPDPHLESDRFMRTPEGKYVIEFRAEGAEYAAVRGLVEDLYAEDPFQATRLLASLRWELPSELEESALRWRSGRLADLGYPTRQEALSWFARPGPRPPSPAGAPARPPGFFLQRIEEGSLLAAAAALAPGRRLHLERELVAAANAVLVADAVDPGDPEAVRRAVATVRGFVELGLEELAGRDPARAAEALASTAVKALFQHGFGRVLALAGRARRLLAAGRIGTPAAPLLDAPLGEAVAALARRRPAYFPGLELPREGWGSPAAAAGEPRGFVSPAEVARAGEALAQAEGLAELAARLGLAPGAGAPSSPRLSTLYLTALANERLGRPFAPEPVAAGEVPAAARALERLEDARLRDAGEAGALLAALARARAEELALVRGGAVVGPGLVTALLVREG